jgi:hypothetical protein
LTHGNAVFLGIGTPGCGKSRRLLTFASLVLQKSLPNPFAKGIQLLTAGCGRPEQPSTGAAAKAALLRRCKITKLRKSKQASGISQLN